MKITDRFNRWIHPYMVKYVERAFLRKSRAVEKKHPELFAPVSSELSKKHSALWGRLGGACGDRWLRLHVNLTGIQDYTFCPEDVFFAKIERVMNDCSVAGHGIEDKNELWRYIPQGCEPDVLIRFVRGSFFDARANWISPSKADDRIKSCKGDLVGKPCQANGGNGVELFSRKNGKHINKSGVELNASWILKQGESYVVQHKINQSEFGASFNRSSINTLRMMTMRCPWDGEIVVCRSMMRMGVSNAVVDNMMKGGLCVCVDRQGSFGKYAYDYDGKRYETHPVSGRRFEGVEYPRYAEIVELAKKIHSTIPYYNLLSFDFVLREDDRICVVEINATSQGITQLQYDFGGLFGENTERVVEWVATNSQYDHFSHVRTFY